MSPDKVFAEHSSGHPQRFDAIIVGAGFAGLYMLYSLRQLGLKVRVLEAGSGVGGTWFWNRYPGARCDVDSLQYCYSFSKEIQRKWRWSERFAPHHEILSYLRFVSQELGLDGDIQFRTTVQS